MPGGNCFALWVEQACEHFVMQHLAGVGATTGVTVDLCLLGGENPFGAGTDSLTGNNTHNVITDFTPGTDTLDLSQPGAGGVVASEHDTATIINGMLNDHSLKVDTV
nr:hypothetical protein [Pseudomonas sp. PDM32]